MDNKDDLLNNNANNNEDTELNNKDEDQDQLSDFSEIDNEKLTVGLYNKIASVVLNILGNSSARTLIKTNANILDLVKLQIANLVFLESKLKKDLEAGKYAKEFLQIVSNIVDSALSINKSAEKNRTAILEDCNLLIVTIINTDKGIEREALERYRTINAQAFIDLNNQILALNDFTTSQPNNNQQGINNNYNPQNQSANNTGQTNTNNNQFNNYNDTNMRDLNNNLANLTKLGVLPQHPATNPKFYPYLTKPTIIPKLKKVLSGMLGVSILLILTAMIISAFVKGQIIRDTTKPAQDFSLFSSSNWILLVVTVGIYAWTAYIFAKPSKLKREIYHTSFFLLGILAFWLVVSIAYFFYTITDNFFLNLLHTGVADADFNNNAVNQLKNLPNFELYKIFSIVAGSINALPILLLVVLILINPRLDRAKIIKANMEYQNAISAAMNGKSYEMDQSLFDNDDSDYSHSHAKKHKHK